MAGSKEAAKQSGQHVSGTNRGEETKEREGLEAGRSDTAPAKTPAHRPTGTSTARDMSGIDPQDPISPASPTNG